MPCLHCINDPLGRRAGSLVERWRWKTFQMPGPASQRCCRESGHRSPGCGPTEIRQAWATCAGCPACGPFPPQPGECSSRFRVLMLVLPLLGQEIPCWCRFPHLKCEDHGNYFKRFVMKVKQEHARKSSARSRYSVLVFFPHAPPCIRILK